MDEAASTDDTAIAASTSTDALVQASTFSANSSNASICITPLSGSQTGSTRALCHLLEFDDAKILLDCGINAHREEMTGESYEDDRIEYLDRLRELAPHLTLVLLSSPTVETLGLLPYLVTRLRLACPIYATFPCRTLGQLTLEEWVEMRSSEEARDPLASSTSSSSAAAGNKKPTLDSRNSAPKLSGLPQPGSLRADDAAWRVSKEDIQLTFSRITPVVYSQVVRLSGRANSPFSLLAHPAGTTLGGTLWSLRSATTDSLLYAPIFNHVKERTLDPASFLIRGKEGRMEVNEAIRRIGILIIPSDKSLKTSTKAKERDKSFLDTITFTLRELNQSILLPVDTIGRFIEIMVLLEQHWAFSTLSPNYPLCMVSRNCEHILFTIRRLAEAFGGQLGADEAERERVLRFKNVRMFESPEALLARYGPDHPKLVLVAPDSLSYGYSRQLLVSTFLSSPRCLILLTNPGAPASMTSHIFNLWNNRQPSSTRYGTGKVGSVIDFDKKQEAEAITSTTTIRLKMRRKVILQGEELMKYLEEQRLNKEKEAKAKAMAERNRRMMEAHDDSDSSDDDDEDADDDDDDDNDFDLGNNGDNGNGMADEDAQMRAIMGDPDNGISPSQGVGKGPAAYAEPGAGPITKGWKRGGPGAIAGPGMNTGGGAWDEFLDDVKASQVGGFDIYVRQVQQHHPSNALKSMTLPLANQGQNTRYRMFPFYERRRRVDGYGEAIDIEGWKTRNKAPEEIENAAANDMAIDGNNASSALGKRKRGDADDSDDEGSKQEAPHKFIVEELAIQVRCKVLVVDMEGKADGRALRSILPLIEPKRLVLINGDPESTQDLASAVTSASLPEENIFTPSVGEKVKIADVTKSFSLRLDDSLMTALALRKIEGYEVVPVKGIIGQSDESTLPVLIPSGGAEVIGGPSIDEEDGLTSDMIIQDESTTLPKLPAPHFIGEIKLALLKANLSTANVPVAFSKGTLVCGPVRLAIAPPSAVKEKGTKSTRLAKLAANSRASPTPEKEDEIVDTSGGKVVVRKEGTQLVLEGAPGDTFYAVRAAIYDMHALASA